MLSFTAYLYVANDLYLVTGSSKYTHISKDTFLS